MSGNNPDVGGRWKSVRTVGQVDLVFRNVPVKMV